jgi:hypothetical protein
MDVVIPLSTPRQAGNREVALSMMDSRRKGRLSRLEGALCQRGDNVPRARPRAGPFEYSGPAV